MKRKHEELFALLFAVTFPMVVGFVVAVRMYIDGVSRTSLFLLGVWIAATCFLWTLPQVLQRLGGKREVVRDERGILIYANSALVAHAVTWLFFVSAAVLACWNVGTNGAVCEYLTRRNHWRSRCVSGCICSQRTRPGKDSFMAGEELRNRVRQLRFENGEMTQRQLAENVGVTRQTIIAIEANRYSPSLKLAFRIAGTFGVAIEDVFQWVQPKRKSSRTRR